MNSPDTNTRQHSLLSILTGMALIGMLLMIDLSPVAAQTMMPIPPHQRTYTGYVRGYFFTAPADFFLLGLRVPTDASSSQMGIHLMKMAAAPPNYGACTSNFTTLGYWPNVPGTSMIPTKHLIRQGEVVAIIGSRWSTAGAFSSINSYGQGGTTTTILGQPTRLYRLLFQGGIMTNPASCISANGTTGNIGRVEMYYGPPCEVPPGNLFVSLVDASGQSQAYTEIPGSVHVKYVVNYPAGASDVSITCDFYRVGDPSPTPAFSATVNDTKLAGVNLVGQQMISVPSGLQTGYYRVIPTVNSKNSCDEYQDSELGELTFMLVDPGTTPCIVWPGDVNNDGLVNFGDRKGLTNYIHDANLNPVWLNGPARYRSDAAANPLTYLEWVAQAAVPWGTAAGCYMDTDGNGIINNFDFIAMKMNWMRDHGPGTAKGNDEFSANTFDMGQNFPNPFNPSTSIQYSAPERSQVRIVVMDLLGREVVTLLNNVVEEGVRTVQFNASELQSGVYIAVATMQGIESGLSFTKSIRMTLNK
jgi:type IX secretion system substrate protein